MIYILSRCYLEFVRRCAGPVANMTFRRKVGATVIFVFIFILFLYHICSVISAGGKQKEGTGRFLYINSPLLLYCTFFYCLLGARAQLSSQNFYRIILESTSHSSL